MAEAENEVVLELDTAVWPLGAMVMGTSSVPFILDFPQPPEAAGEVIPIIGKTEITLSGRGARGLLGGDGQTIMVGRLDFITMYQKGCDATLTTKMLLDYGVAKNTIIPVRMPLTLRWGIVKTINEL